MKKRQARFFTIVIAMAAVLVATPNVLASTGAETEEHGIATIFLWVAVLLILAKLVSLIERFGQPAVLGELVLGVVLVNVDRDSLVYATGRKRNYQIHG
jgi:hypothetical protein